MLTGRPWCCAYTLSRRLATNEKLNHTGTKSPIGAPLPKTRSPENRGLPNRWQFTHGAYYYRVPPGLEHLWDGYKRFPLGKKLSEAYKLYAERIDTPDRIRTIGALLDRYLLEVVPTKAPSNRSGNVSHIKKLRAVFGNMPLLPFKPALVYTYVSKSKSKTSAHRQIEVLSHAFTKAVQWGLIDNHPFFRQVVLEGERPRTRYIEDWEIVEALRLPSYRKKGSVLACQAYIRLKLVTGLARGDMLRLRLDEHLQEDGIHVTRHKTKDTTGKTTIYEYDRVPERLTFVNEAKAVRPALSPFLFCNRFGKGYLNEEKGTANGFDSMWGRFMDRVLAETKLKVRFTEHDLRAKVGSDADSLEKARALLQHASVTTTLKIYRRKPERV